MHMMKPWKTSLVMQLLVVQGNDLFAKHLKTLEQWNDCTWTPCALLANLRLESEDRHLQRMPRINAGSPRMKVLILNSKELCKNCLPLSVSHLPSNSTYLAYWAWARKNQQAVGNHCSNSVKIQGEFPPGVSAAYTIKTTEYTSFYN